MSTDSDPPVAKITLTYHGEAPVPVLACELFRRALHGDCRAARELAEAMGVQGADFRELARRELEGLIRQVALAAGGGEETVLAVIAIANDRRKTIDEKMDAIIRADHRYAMFRSPQWAGLVRDKDGGVVTEAAIRGTRTWKTSQIIRDKWRHEALEPRKRHHADTGSMRESERRAATHEAFEALFSDAEGPGGG